MKLKLSRDGRFVFAFRFPLALLMLCCLGLPPATSQASPPTWWTARGAVSSSATPNANAVVNQGQLKEFTARAVDELNADYSASIGAGSSLNSLVIGWKDDYATNGYALNTASPYKLSDFNAMTVGQLKQIASLIYAQLVAVGYVSTLPTWIVKNTSTDGTAAVLGQLKMVFDFSPPAATDSNNDGLPDAWEQRYFGTLNVNPNALAPGGSGLTNLQEYKLGLNPTVASTMGDAFTDGWKVNHNLNPYHKIVADPTPPVVNLQVYTPLQ